MGARVETRRLSSYGSMWRKCVAKVPTLRDAAGRGAALGRAIYGGVHQLTTASTVHTTNRVTPGSGSTLGGRVVKSTDG
jgi:hypothetical protein